MWLPLGKNSVTFIKKRNYLYKKNTVAFREKFVQEIYAWQTLPPPPHTHTRGDKNNTFSNTYNKHLQHCAGINKIFKKYKINAAKAASCSGRSMVEMLGVLALLGVLTISSLITYRYTLDKHNANIALDEVARRQVVLDSQTVAGHNLNLDEFPQNTQNGYPVSFKIPDDNKSFYIIRLENIPKGVCNHIVTSNFPAIILVNEKIISNQNNCKQNNILDFIFNINSDWCKSKNEQGECCDANGLCCPPDKPLIDSSGKCTSCYGAQTINVKDYEYTCDRCSNRDLVNNTWCSLECPDGTYRTIYGGCISCDTVTQQTVEDTPENIAKILACPNMVLGYQYSTLIATHCDSTTQTATVKDYEYTCDRCSNRELVGDTCVLK